MPGASTTEALQAAGAPTANKTPDTYNPATEKEERMTTNDAMKLLTDAMKLNGAAPEQTAQMEIAIQYIGNPDFRKWLEEFVFNANYENSRTKGAPTHEKP